MVPYTSEGAVEAMFRTQVYLTEKERKKLRDRAQSSGRAKSDLLRQAIDEFLEKEDDEKQKAAFESVCGMWKERKDLPDFEAIRRSSDRWKELFDK
jgi:hypothetical protein